jgi:cyclase
MAVMRSFLLVVFILAQVLVRQGQGQVHVTKLSPNLLVFSTSTGNVIASVGPDGALLVGTPSASSTPEINQILAAYTKSHLRYVVIAPESLEVSEGDAGWGRLGAFVAMQENALGRLGGHAMGKPLPLPPRLVRLGVGRPKISFSEVLCFDMNGEAIHVVRQTPGYSNADAIVHYHVANVVYMGEVFPGDGYPMVDATQSGTLAGLVKTLSSWTGVTFRVVPARGAVTDGTRVQAFLDMIAAVRGRVKKMHDAGRSEQQVIASHPTRDFDKEWGRGRVSPDTFVKQVYQSVVSSGMPQ